MDDLHDCRERLACRLEQQAVQKTDSGLRALALALLGHPAPNLGTCAQVQDALPEYVEAEVRGDPAWVEDKRASVRSHLMLCVECGRLHARLLQIAWLLERDDLPHPPYRPAPRLPIGGRSE